MAGCDRRGSVVWRMKVGREYLLLLAKAKYHTNRHAHSIVGFAKEIRPEIVDLKSTYSHAVIYRHIEASAERGGETGI